VDGMGFDSSQWCQIIDLIFPIERRIILFQLEKTMALAYTKDFLISAFLSRFINAGGFTVEQVESLEKLAIDCYDKYGRDAFRKYACLDAEAIRRYKQFG
jgi:hypothetical protein